MSLSFMESKQCFSDTACCFFGDLKLSRRDLLCESFVPDGKSRTDSSYLVFGPVSPSVCRELDLGHFVFGRLEAVR